MNVHVGEKLILSQRVP